MCGILGQFTFSPNGGGLEAKSLSRLLDLMARRGPDDEGRWTDGSRCTLGARRLTVLDLSMTGHQPMMTREGRFVIVYNGELYNFRDLRHELEQEGVQFRSTGDTEVVLYALAHWGTGALSRFNGMFALGFYDTVEQRLLLARDHAGMKPLYYLLTSHGLVFASQYDQILAHPWSQSLNLSSEALALYLRMAYIPAPYGLLQNTHLLEPGTWIEATAEGPVRSGRFFEFPVHRDPDLRGEEAYEAVDAAVTAAVRRHVVSDAPLGAFLSGGIDSPLIAAKMRAVIPDPVRAFTIGFDGDPLDESSQAITYAREIGVDHVVEPIKPDGIVDLLDEVVAACGEPFADYSIFPTLLASRLARQQVKVVLSGDGGDELFWGYVKELGFLINKVTATRKQGTTQGTGLDLKRLLALGQASSDRRWPTTIGEYYRIRLTHFPEGWIRRILPDDSGWPVDLTLFDYSGWDEDHTAQWLRWNEFMGHLQEVLLKVDRASMYHSLEVRIPLLDRDVLDVATRVEWRSCLDIERQIGKLPLRTALARHVNNQTRAKRGFTAPMGRWLRGPLRPVFEAFVLEPDDIVGFPVNKAAIREMFDQHLAQRSDHGWSLWILLSLALWQHRHYKTHRSKPESS